MTDEQNAANNFIHVMPIYLQEGTAVQAIVTGIHPWGPPSALALSGGNSDQADKLIIAFESPSAWLRPSQPLPQRQLELLHAQRFATDVRLASGVEVFDAIEEGPDPPDFIARTGDSGYGLECTSLTLEERRTANALFRLVRRRLADQPRWRLGHLSGYFVYLWFGSQQSPLTRPFRKTDKDSAAELVEALVSYRPNPDQLRHVGIGSLPEQLPGLGSVTTPSKATFYAVPMTNALPGGPFFAATGFEIGLCYTTSHTSEAAWNEVQRLISKHDKPGVEVLLVTVGAPDENGEIHPAEELLANLILQQAGRCLSSNHIRRALMHMWSSGKVIDLLEDQATEFSPAIFSGMVTQHYPILRQDAPRDSDSAAAP